MTDGGRRLLPRAVLPLACAVIQTGWLYPWALLIGLWARPGSDLPLLPGPAILLLTLGADFATRWVLGQGWALSRARIFLITLGLMASVVVLRLHHYTQYGALDPGWLGALAADIAAALPSPPSPVLATLFALFVWWRGLARGRSRIELDAVEGAFKTGLAAILAFVATALAAMPDRWGLLQADATLYVTGFLAASLVGLSLARLEAVRQQSSRGARDGLRLDRRWLAVMLGVVAVLMLVTLGLAQILSFDLIAAVAGPVLGPLGALLALALEALALVVGLLLTPLFYLIQWLRQGREPTAWQSPDLSGLERLQREGAEAVLPPELALIAKWTAITVVALLALLVLARTVARQKTWAGDDEVDEERDSVWNWALAVAALLAWLRSRWGLAARRRSTEPAAGTRSVETRAGSQSAATIRQVYWRLMLLGSRLGVDRAVGATAYEHLPRLKEHVQPVEEVTAITEAYVRARYGHIPPTTAETDEVRARWQRVVARREDAGEPPDGSGW